MYDPFQIQGNFERMEAGFSETEGRRGERGSGWRDGLLDLSFQETCAKLTAILTKIHP